MPVDAIICINKRTAAFPGLALGHVALTVAPEFLQTSIENDPYTKPVWRRTPIIYRHYFMSSSASEIP